MASVNVKYVLQVSHEGITRVPAVIAQLSLPSAPASSGPHDAGAAGLTTVLLMYLALFPCGTLLLIYERCT